MAECNYDEVTHSIYPQENPDPMYHWDAHFPERLSRLHLSLEFSSPVFRRSRRAKERSTGRYKTQPITFDEITEVDEDSSTTTVQSSTAAQAPDNCREAKTTLFRHQIPGFSRSVDGLVASGYVLAKSGTSTGSSDKENTPCDPDRIPDLCSTEEEDENRSQTNCSSSVLEVASSSASLLTSFVIVASDPVADCATGTPFLKRSLKRTRWSSQSGDGLSAQRGLIQLT